MFELLERGELLELPAEKPLSEEEAWKSFRDVILGLEYCEYSQKQGWLVSTVKI